MMDTSNQQGYNFYDRRRERDGSSAGGTFWLSTCVSFSPFLVPSPLLNMGRGFKYRTAQSTTVVSAFPLHVMVGAIFTTIQRGTMSIVRYPRQRIAVVFLVLEPDYTHRRVRPIPFLASSSPQFTYCEGSEQHSDVEFLPRAMKLVGRLDLILRVTVHVRTMTDLHSLILVINTVD